MLEIGCGTGDLLDAVRPSHGVGVDFADGMLDIARRRYPSLTFVQVPADEFDSNEIFDVIICSDLVNDLWDVQRVLERCRAVAGPRTRLILNFYSRLWEAPLRAAKALGLSRPLLDQNWLTVPDAANLLALSGYDIVRHWEGVLWPVPTPAIEPVCNRVLVKLWPFSLLALTHVVVARVAPAGGPRCERPLVSVVVPARNEAGNIERIFRGCPKWVEAQN